MPVLSSRRWSPEHRGTRAQSVDEWFALPEERAGEPRPTECRGGGRSRVTHELIVAWIVSGPSKLECTGGAASCSIGHEAETRRAARSNAGREAYLPGGAKAPAARSVPVPTRHRENRDRVADPEGHAARSHREDERTMRSSRSASTGLIDPVCAPARDLRTGGGRLYRRALGASAGKVESVPGCPSLTLDLDEALVGARRTRSGLTPTVGSRPAQGPRRTAVPN